MQVTLHPKGKVSARTRNRLREHPGVFTVQREASPVCFDGRPAVLVEHPDGWSGWLPLDEVEVVEVA